jgi:epoxyqueuosine reductase
MVLQPLSDQPERIIDTAKSFGASLVGFTHAVSLRNSPSDDACGHTGVFNKALSILVIALAHKAASPELDWWDNARGGTPGNRMLMSISGNLVQWLTEQEIHARDVPYNVEKGGIFLKEAAVLSGIGIAGKNNLLVTPEYGPRVRLRAVFIDMNLESTGLLDFNPCESCSMPCRKVCPRNAFISGFYSSSLCYKQMNDDEANAVICEESEYYASPRMCVKYCRSCELACPVGVSSYG